MPMNGSERIKTDKRKIDETQGPGAVGPLTVADWFKKLIFLKAKGEPKVRYQTLR